MYKHEVHHMDTAKVIYCNELSEAHITLSVRNRTRIIATNLEDRLSGEKDPSCTWVSSFARKESAQGKGFSLDHDLNENNRL